MGALPAKVPQGLVSAYTGGEGGSAAAGFHSAVPVQPKRSCSHQGRDLDLEGRVTALGKFCVAGVCMFKA